VALSVLDLFTIGIGPSSSHTVGPMRAARRFVTALEGHGRLEDTASVRVELFGSLGATGRGHGTDRAIILGLEGEQPETVDPDAMPARVNRVSELGELRLLGRHATAFRPAEHLIFHRLRSLPLHPNGMVFVALERSGAPIAERRYYSVGGGFVVDDEAPRSAPDASVARSDVVPNPFTTGADLLVQCARRAAPISALVLENERALWGSEELVRGRLRAIWDAMQQCVSRGCRRPLGELLPGGLKVPRRAPALFQKLESQGKGGDPLAALDRVNLWALAVNEENAGGGRVVTAPTNGAAGIIPAVLHHYLDAVHGADEAHENGVIRFLLVAGAVATLYKIHASISGAEVGCQGEVGVACSMAAAGLAEVLGGTPPQVENAAEIGMEHNLGLTCDPIGGLVQVPCIERNAMGAVKAINAARIALSGDGQHKVSLDKVIATMRATGADMLTKYKETARGGLAVNVVEC
jgi:L-serine dehydratase